MCHVDDALPRLQFVVVSSLLFLAMARVVCCFLSESFKISGLAACGLAVVFLVVACEAARVSQQQLLLAVAKGHAQWVISMWHNSITML